MQAGEALRSSKAPPEAGQCLKERERAAGEWEGEEHLSLATPTPESPVLEAKWGGGDRTGGGRGRGGRKRKGMEQAWSYSKAKNVLKPLVNS